MESYWVCEVWSRGIGRWAVIAPDGKLTLDPVCWDVWADPVRAWTALGLWIAHTAMAEPTPPDDSGTVAYPVRCQVRSLTAAEVSAWRGELPPVGAVASGAAGGPPAAPRPVGPSKPRRPGRKAPVGRGAASGGSVS